MASRRTARSQPTSILKPGQTPGTQGSRGNTRDSRYSEADDEKTYYSGSQGSQTQGTTRGKTGGSKKPLSLFDVVKKAKTNDDDDGGEGVKTDNIWSKFVSDDANVVRAPTAETEVTRISGSTRSYHTGDSKLSQGTQRTIEEEEEGELSSSDDDRTIYSDYYLPPEYQRPEGTPEPRAEIVDSHEACSCFPNRSNKFLGSMLYDKIVCKHTGIQGETQPGVFKFNPYWNENMEEPRKLRKRDMHVGKTKFVFGYPKPKFELIPDSEEEDFDDEDEEGESGDDGEEADDGPGERVNDEDGGDRKGTTRGTARTAKTVKQADDDDDDDEEDSEYDSDEFDYDDDDESDDEDFIPFQLPQIGIPYTPSLPPSSHQSFRSRYSDFTESYADSLPSLPASRQQLVTAGSGLSRRTGVTQRTQRTQFTLPATEARQETRRSTKTAKTSKTTSKSKAKSDKEESIDSGYDEDRSRRTVDSRQSLPAGPVISAARTFQGKFYDPVTKQVMLYDIGTRPGERMPAGNMEPLNPKPPTAASAKPVPKSQTGSKPGSKHSQRSNTSKKSEIGPTAALLGGVFISNLLRKNKKNKEDFEAADEGEEET